MNDESVKKKAGGAGDMSHYMDVTPLAIMREDMSLFNPEQSAAIR